MTRLQMALKGDVREPRSLILVDERDRVALQEHFPLPETQLEQLLGTAAYYAAEGFRMNPAWGRWLRVAAICTETIPSTWCFRPHQGPGKAPKDLAVWT